MCSLSSPKNPGDDKRVFDERGLAFLCRDSRSSQVTSGSGTNVSFVEPVESQLASWLKIQRALQAGIADWRELGVTCLGKARARYLENFSR